MKIILGVLILVNIFFWPKFVSLTDWIAFFAVLMVLGGIVHLIKPCNCCPMPAQKKKK